MTRDIGASMAAMINPSIHLINQAPLGTKLWILHLGNVEADNGFFLRGCGASMASNPEGYKERRKMVMIGILISHPTEGLILYETGAGKDYPEVWGAPMNDIFARVDYSEEQELDVVIRKTGNDIKDIRAVIMGHLHMDHAGGLEHFLGTDIPIYVHEQELKHAFCSVATGSDLGVYLPKDLNPSLNWKTFTGPFLEIAQGIDLWHTPGHTPGLVMMQVNMPFSGTWLFTTDQYHVWENYEQSHPQGWLARDHDDWVQSNQKIHALAKRTNAKLIFGHCRETMMKYRIAPEFYE